MGLNPLSPTQGPPNTAITVSGTGLGKKANIQVYVDGAVKVSTRANNQGGFSAVVYAPSGSDRSVPIIVKSQTGSAGWQQVLPTLTFLLKNVALPPPPDTTPPVISNVVASGLSQNGITVTWDLNENGSGQIQYGTVASGAFGSSTTAVPGPQTHFSQIITGLAANTDYQYRIKSLDVAGNQAPLVTRTFKTLAVPPAAPTMSNVRVIDFDQTSATIAWDLSEPCTGQVEYGETTVLGTFGPFENSFIYSSHEMDITGLTPNKKYYFKPRSQAQNGLWATPPSGLNFTTLSDAAPPPPNVTYPMDRSALQIVSLPSIPSLPAYLGTFNDSIWGTKLTRVSSQAGYRHAYSRLAGWNIDETLICLGGVYPARILDGTTYAELRTIANEPMMMWSNVDPNKLWSCRGNKLQVHNATTGAFSTFHAFSGYVDGTHTVNGEVIQNISIGHYEGGIDDNDEWIALIGWNGSANRLITFNLLTNEIHDIPAPAGIGDCQISRKGNYVTFTCSAGTQRYPRSLAGSPLTLHSSTSHGDNCLDINGVEVFVSNAPSPGDAPASFRLTDGFKTVLFPGLGYTYFQPGHVSGRNLKRNGWVYLSNYDETFYGYNNVLAGKDQLAAVKLDGSGAVEVFGFANHGYDAVGDQNRRYRNEVQATVSPRGNRMLFASNWRNLSIEPHCFVAAP